MTRAADPWIELHVGLAAHPKLIRLQVALDLPRPTALGHLILLWLWALTYAPDGSLKRFSDDEIAHAAHYDPRTGVPAAFVGALVASGWIDRRTRRLHDWGLYAGRLLEQRARNAERMRAARAPHVSGNQTLPDSTNRTRPTGPDQVPARGRARDAEFEALADGCGIDWHHLTDPARAALNAALKAIRGAGDADPDEIHRRVAAYRATYPDVALTPSAIAKHWPALANGARTAGPTSQADRMLERLTREGESNRGTGTGAGVGADAGRRLPAS